MKGLPVLSVASVITMALAQGSASASLARQTDPLSVVRSFEEAYNAHDVDGGLALVAEDAVFTFVPPRPDLSVVRGKAEIRAWLENAAANQEHVETSAHQVAGDKVTLFARVRGVSLQQLGVDYIEGPTEIVVRDGKITSFTYTLTQQTVEKMQAAIAAAQPAGMPRTGIEHNAIAPFAAVAAGLLFLALGNMVKSRLLARR